MMNKVAIFMDKLCNQKLGYFLSDFNKWLSHNINFDQVYVYNVNHLKPLVVLRFYTTTSYSRFSKRDTILGLIIFYRTLDIK